MRRLAWCLLFVASCASGGGLNSTLDLGKGQSTSFHFRKGAAVVVRVTKGQVTATTRVGDAEAKMTSGIGRIQLQPAGEGTITIVADEDASIQVMIE